MLYRPQNGRIWDPTVIRYQGIFYAFTMYYEKGAEESYAMRLATSPDGVHWTDQGNIITDKTNPVWKMFIFRTQDGTFSLNHGSKSRPDSENDTLHYYQSRDLLHWTYLGSNRPDPRWYEPEIARWDHMYCLPSEKEGYIGYTVAIPKEEYHSLIGIQRSTDGLSWHACPPPVIDWDGLEPVREMEIGGCEKIGDTYYLMGGICPPFDGNYGYSCYVFTSPQEDGPFKPDKEALRLCGFNGRRGEIFVQTLAAFCRDYDNGELLVSNTLWYDLDDAQNNNWLLPLRTAKTDTEGHLCLHYYPGNDALKGPLLSTLDAAQVCTRAHDGYQLADEYAFLDLAHIDPQKGAVIEGTLTATPWPERGPVRAGCFMPSMAGFYIEETPNSGTVIFAECANTRNRSVLTGTLNTTSGCFIPEDRISGCCASPNGIDVGVPYTFRLLIRYGMFELYLNDMHVQTYTTAAMPAGRIRLALQNCKCSLENVTVYEMNL